jgi:hypothetical protein
MKIESVPILDVSFHPAIQQLPPAPEDLIQSLIVDLQDRSGPDWLMTPLVVDEKTRVIEVDSADRLKAALKLDFLEVPVIRRPNNEALATMIDSIARRRNYSKSAIAYVLFPFFEPALTEARERMKRCRFGSTQNVLPSKTAEDIARKAGVSRALFFQAAEVHKLFKKHPHVREAIEPQILSGDLSLGYAINGIAGLVSTKGKDREQPELFDLFKRGVHALRVRFARWNQLSPKWQHFVANEFADAIADAPEEVQERVMQALRARKQGARS